MPRPEISHVLFDFDGTLSLILEAGLDGRDVRRDAAASAVGHRPGARLVLDDIADPQRQADHLSDDCSKRAKIKERGGEPREPLWYKHEYLRRLELKISSRTSGIADGSIPRDEYLVHGARPFLDHLKACGLTLYLASGTDEYAVRREAAAGVLDDFGPHVYGPGRLQRVLQEDDHRQDPPGESDPRRHLLSFGDGYVEIQNTHEVGGFAVAMATDEAANGSGKIDPWKRERLLGSGERRAPRLPRCDLAGSIITGTRLMP